MMPVAGGTTVKLSKACWPHLRNSYRSRLRSNSRSALNCRAAGEPKASTCTEWSMTRSVGTRGLIFLGSPPTSRIALRIAARSTTAGTPVKSCMTTRAGRYASSPPTDSGHEASALTSSSATNLPPQLRKSDSRMTRIENGSEKTSPSTFSSNLFRLWIVTSPALISSLDCASKALFSGMLLRTSSFGLIHSDYRGSRAAYRRRRLYTCRHGEAWLYQGHDPG